MIVLSSMNEPSNAQSWKKVHLGDVCCLRAESVHPTENDEAVYVGLEHIDSGDTRLARSGLAADVTSAKSRFRRGDILYGKLRPYLDKAVQAKQDGICSTDILVLKANESALPDYLAYLVHSNAFLQYAIRTTRGVNHPRTSWASLKGFEFAIPPLPEQRAITRALGAVQKAKEARQRELAFERERKAALMQYLFTHGTRGEVRKPTKLGEFPESWQLSVLGEVFQTQLGKMLSQKSKTGQNSKPYLRNANVQWGRVNCSDILEMDFSKKECERFRLKYGDILVCEGGEVGRTAVWRDELPECYFQKAIHRLRPVSDEMDSGFFLHWMERAFRLTNLYGVAGTQTTIAHLPQEKLTAMHIPMPPLQEQVKIASALNACDGKVKSLEKETGLLHELFKTMLEELMTGRLSALPLVKAAA